MKRLFKSRLFFFILGLTIASSLAIVLAYSNVATDVGFTPTDTTWKTLNGDPITNVNDALNSLKIKTFSIPNIIDNVTTYSLHYEKRDFYTAEKELNKGTYICSAIYSTSGYNGKSSQNAGQYGETVQTLSISNCDYYSEIHYKKQYMASATMIQFPDTNYLYTALITDNFICRVDSTKNITASYGYSLLDDSPVIFELYCSKLD
ncbi:MAG: hypothetical protein IKP79_02175 [Bacilli bacterium]|nr:hypothetical protein [Bacilli bacterium]